MAHKVVSDLPARANLPDKRNGRRFGELYNLWIKENLTAADIIEIVDSIYDNTDYDDLLFLAYVFASYKTPLARQLLAHYGALRPDRFEGWDQEPTITLKNFHKLGKLDQSISKRGRKYSKYFGENDPLVTIYLPAYNELEYVRLCVESLYKYTGDIHYDLICKDNGSDDNVLEYFKRLPKTKAIARSERNGPNDFTPVLEPFPNGDINVRGKYWVSLSADVILTPNWLKNLLICAANNPEAVQICPTSHNGGVPFKQSVGIDAPYTMQEMLEFAKKNNVSDPRRWEEHISLIDFVVMVPLSITRLCGAPDQTLPGNLNSDYDKCIKVKKAGLKIVCPKDVYCHHFGGVTLGTLGMQTRANRQTSMQILKEKHRGCDITKAVRSNSINYIIKLFDEQHKAMEKAVLLGVDDVIGEALQLISNSLKRRNVKRIDCYGHAADPDDIATMRFVCKACTVGNIDVLSESWQAESFDYIICNGYINQYDNITSVINILLKLLKKDGKIIAVLRNALNFNNLFDKIANPSNAFVNAFATNATRFDFEYAVKKSGGMIEAVELEKLPMESIGSKLDIIKAIANAIGTETAFDVLTTSNYIFRISKGVFNNEMDEQRS